MIFGVPHCVIGFTDICVGITWITCNYDVKNTDAVFISDSFQYLPFTFVKYSCVCVFSSFFKNTRVALDHLESIPEKQLLMENFRDLEVGITYNLDYFFYLTVNERAKINRVTAQLALSHI